jgi:dihydroorotate dehydrogenase
MLTPAELLARADAPVRAKLVQTAPRLATSVYSSGRNAFLAQLCAERPTLIVPPEQHTRTVWGLHFRSGLFNAAGMFKNGEGYELCLRQGAGAYLAGTTTAHPRTGNHRRHERGFATTARPFLPYPTSGAASNWLGLPNDGHAAVAKRLAGCERTEGFPMGASLMTAPESSGVQALEELVEGMWLYERAGVDFLEINESCPNVAHGSSSLEAITERLEYISQKFLVRRTRRLPVIVKFSTDAAPQDVPALVDALLTLRFDGVNFGNTSTKYAQLRMNIAPNERSAFDAFTQTFGGGVSGLPLNTMSLELVRHGAEYVRSKSLSHEFHVIRTGGIATANDVQASFDAGAALCQWYTGYFEGFARHGHKLYAALYQEFHNLSAHKNVVL